MGTISDIRRANMALIRESFRTALELARVLEIPSTMLSQLKLPDKDGVHRKNIGDVFARKIETKLSLPHGWMDTPHSESPLPPLEKPNASHVGSASRKSVSAIQAAVLETAQRLMEAKLLSDLDCVTLLQNWQPLIAQLDAK